MRGIKPHPAARTRREVTLFWTACVETAAIHNGAIPASPARIVGFGARRRRARTHCRHTRSEMHPTFSLAWFGMVTGRPGAGARVSSHRRPPEARPQDKDARADSKRQCPFGIYLVHVLTSTSGPHIPAGGLFVARLPCGRLPRGLTACFLSLTVRNRTPLPYAGERLLSALYWRGR
jgi:hypothetical protein